MKEDLHSEADALRVRDDLLIPRGELMSRATRASGPGGQHVNTSSTRIELLWNVRGSAVLTPEQKELIAGKLAKRIDSDGWLRIVAAESRSQLRNRRLAEERLVSIVKSALHVPRRRRATKPTQSSRQERLRTKKLHSRKKEDRRTRTDD